MAGLIASATMDLSRVSCRPGEETAFGKPHCRSLGRIRVSQLGCSRERISIVGMPLSVRSLATAGALWRSSVDSTTSNATLQKRIQVTLELCSF